MKSDAAWGYLGSALPLIGLCILSCSRAHPAWRAQGLAETAPPSLMLLAPDPRMNQSFAIFLRQQYHNVAQDRVKLRLAEKQNRQARTPDSALLVRDRQDGLYKSISDYNLLAREADEGVFDAVRLPPALTQ